MSSMRLARACLILVACSSAAVSAATNEILLINGKIFTGNPQSPYAESVSIRDGKFVAVGNRFDVKASVQGDAKVVDLGGKTLLPGLIDSHVHAIYGGIGLLSADAQDMIRDVAALEAFAAEAKKSGRGMSGDVLVVTGVPLAIWSHIPELNERFNGGVYANQPVFFGGMDGHTGWSNAALRKRAGLNKAYISKLAEAKRKYYGVQPDLTPNGFGVDEGLDVVQKKIPPTNPAKQLAGAEEAVKYLHSLGITSWLDPAVDAAQLNAYRDLAAANKLTAHVAAFVVVKANQPKPLQEALELKAKFANVPNLTVPGVKVFADGVVEYPSQSAAMTAPYKNTGKMGDLLFEPAKFAQLCIDADKQGLIVHTHAIGDLAVHETLNGYEAARKANGDSKLPHTITHLQFVRGEDVPRFKPLGVVASYQLLWAAASVDSIDLVKPYVDPDIYPWQVPGALHVACRHRHCRRERLAGVDAQCIQWHLRSRNAQGTQGRAGREPGHAARCHVVCLHHQRCARDESAGVDRLHRAGQAGRLDAGGSRRADRSCRRNARHAGGVDHGRRRLGVPGELAPGTLDHGATCAAVTRSASEAACSALMA